MARAAPDLIFPRVEEAICGERVGAKRASALEIVVHRIATSGIGVGASRR